MAVDYKKLVFYMGVSFIAAFFAALGLVPALTSLAITKAFAAGGAAAGLAGKAFLDQPCKDKKETEKEEDGDVKADADTCTK